MPLLGSEVSNDTRSLSQFSSFEAQLLMVQGCLAPLQRAAPAWGRAGVGAAAQGGRLGCLDQWVCVYIGGWEGRAARRGLEAVRSLSGSTGVIVSTSSSSSSLSSVLWKPLTVSVMLAGPGVPGAEGGEWRTWRAWGIAGSINPFPSGCADS